MQTSARTLVASLVVVAHATAVAPALAQPPPQPAPPPTVQPVPYVPPAPVPYNVQSPPPPLPAAPRPATAPAGSDAIYLKNGGILRGTLIDAIPNAHARIRLDTGDVATVQWGEILRIEAASRPPGLGPAPAPAPAANPGAVVGATVLVHIDSPRPVELEQNQGGQWSVACSSPCDVSLPISGQYRINGSGVRRSRVFGLAGQPGQRVVIQIDPGATSGFVLGIVSVSLGSAVLGVGLLVGLVTLAFCNSSTSSSSSGCDEARSVALTTTLVGGAGLIGGIIALTSNASTKVTQEVGSAAPAQARAPLWRDLREGGPTPPTNAGITIPVLRGQF